MKLSGIILLTNGQGISNFFLICHPLLGEPYPSCLQMLYISGNCERISTKVSGLILQTNTQGLR
jgi:hypothetical protein